MQKYDLKTITSNIFLENKSPKFIEVPNCFRSNFQSRDEVQ